MRYFLPQKAITAFLSHAVNNFSDSDLKHIETLAYLFGNKSEDEVTVTDIIFPEQKGSSGHVDDLGKYNLKEKIYLILSAVFCIQSAICLQFIPRNPLAKTKYMNLF